MMLNELLEQDPTNSLTEPRDNETVGLSSQGNLPLTPLNDAQCAQSSYMSKNPYPIPQVLGSLDRLGVLKQDLQPQCAFR